MADGDRNASNQSEARALCVQCGTLGVAKREEIGTRFTCPNEQRFKPHVAYVVADPGITPWMRFEAFLVSYQSRWSPLRQISAFRAKGRKGRVGLYLLCRFLFLLVPMIGLAYAADSRWTTSASALVAFVVVLDILISQTSGVFTSRWPAHPLRTVLLSFFAFVQVALAYAIFFSILRLDFKEPITPFQAFYFSMVTIATVGYGDIVPSTSSTLLQVAVVSEILVGLYFLAVLLAQIVAWVSERPPRPKVLAEVLAAPQTTTPQCGG